jgi:hypothetical protein
MKRDAFSDAVLPSWMRSSFFGFCISVIGMVAGGVVRHLLRGEVSTPAIVARVIAAGVYGFGIGFSLFFLVLMMVGALYAVLHRR